jgi:hypothetical protein
VRETVREIAARKLHARPASDQAAAFTRYDLPEVREDGIPAVLCSR